MCGRFALTCTAEDLVETFGLVNWPDVEVPRYNIAPTQPIGIVRFGADGGRVWSRARWGLIPAWSKEPTTSFSTFNARAETVADKPAFRAAFRHRRCLIPATQYYEWKTASGSKAKQPHALFLASGRPLAFAGLWESWRQGDVTLESCTIIVTAANALASTIHDRMPVILAPSDFDTWLDPSRHSPDELSTLLQPYAAEDLRCHAVNPRINNARNDDADAARPCPVDLFS